MDTVFPFGLPGPTAFYLVLYVLTFAIHQALVHYVLAGSIFVAGTMLVPTPDAAHRGRRPLAAMLREWMPLMLSAAITAGVAPLLFIQILYQEQFYTANILLYWRWLIVIPVLIVAFYLLYLIRSQWIVRAPWLVRSVIVIITAVSIVFVGFCWTANYLLSTSQAQWPDVYATGDLPFSTGDVLLRMLVWGGGAFASMAVILGWQLAGPAAPDEEKAARARPLALVAMAGMVVALAGGVAYMVRMEPSIRSQLTGPSGLPYLVAAAVGLALQGAGWLMQWRRGAIGRAWLSTVTIGWLASLVSVSALREITRWTSLDTASLLARHAHAREIGGFELFLAFAVVNFVVIGGCVWAVRRAK
jgi:hypothetical protein